MTALSPIARLALKALVLATQHMMAAREANNVLDEEGLSDHPDVNRARRQLAEEAVLTEVSCTRVQLAIDAEKANRQHDLNPEMRDERAE